MNPFLLVIASFILVGIGMAAGLLLASWRLDLGSAGASLIARERRRQRQKGYTMDHDRLHIAQHGLGYLGSMSAAYAVRGVTGNTAAANAIWPLGDAMPPQHEREGLPGAIVDLVNAGACAAAEIDLQERLATDFKARQEIGREMSARMDAQQTATPRNEGIA